MRDRNPFEYGRMPKLFAWQRGFSDGAIAAGSEGTVELLVADETALAEEPETITATNESGVEIPDDTLVYVLPPPIGGSKYYIFWANICEG